MAQLSIIELIIRTTSVRLGIQESIVERVIHHKHKSVLDAQKLHRTIEDSGLGTYKVRPKVAIKRIAKIERDLEWLSKQLQDGNELSESKIQGFQRNTEKLIEEKKYLESKI